MPHTLATHTPSMLARVLFKREWCAAVVALLLAALGGFAPRAQAATPQMSDLMKLSEAAGDPEQAAALVKNLRSLIVNASDSVYAGILRQSLVKALVTSKAPVAEIAASADTAGRMMVGPPVNKVAFYASVAQVLAERGDAKRAVTFGRKALAALPANDQTPGLRGFALAQLGLAHLNSGKADSAVYYFQTALPATPDSQEVLRYLGAAYTKLGKKDEAIDVYVRSLAVFPAKDTTGTGALQAVYRSKNKSLDGLDARLDAARKASRAQIALAPRRHERAAPKWTLQNLEGVDVSSDAYSGKVTVVDFWGSWCGPCRIELPIIEALYQRYREHPEVRILGINWERDAANHAKRAREYMAQNKLTFPVVIDPQQSAVRSYNVQGFPSVFVIDPKGQIRYQNVGVAENIDAILEAQIESLLE